MQIINKQNGLYNFPSSALDAVTAIGNFDGVHVGHQYLLKKARKIANKSKRPFNVITFEPHPYTFFKKKKLPFRITPLQSKIRVLEDLKVDNLIIINFDEEFASLSPEEFVLKYLVDLFKVSHIVVGRDFTFGKGGKGTPKTLKELGKQYNFKLTRVKDLVPDYSLDRFSSTTVRSYISNGHIVKANKMLGRAWELEGIVQSGTNIGTSMGFPTANIITPDYISPRKGVYAVKVGIKDEKNNYSWHNAIANFGYRPTIGGEGLLLEVHILDFNENIYGKNIRAKLLDFLRPEIKYDTIEELRQNIVEDVCWAKLFFREEPLPEKSGEEIGINI